MRRVALFGSLLALLVAACGPSRVDLEAQARKLLQQAVDENPALHAAGVRVESTQLVHEGATKYAGIATVAVRGTGPQNVPFTLLFDGERVMVQTQAGAFEWAIALAPTEKPVADEAADHLPQPVSSQPSPVALQDTSGWPDRVVAGEPWKTPYGVCFRTTVARVETRLQDTPDSGSAITYTNGAYQVSYETEPGIESSRPDDEVRLCVIERDKSCSAKEDRGNTYQARNLRTGAVWELPDSEHECAGA